jgi:predicted N-formylglutamate amidohydrolase
MHQILITCEHGGNKLPLKYKTLFKGHEALLDSHKGIDYGALELAEHIVSQFHFPFYFSKISRLVVELNRSLDSKELFSEVTAKLPEEEKEHILETVYYPYRDLVESKIDQLTKAGNTVYHISCHSFTPVLDGKERNADMGILFDPARKTETEFSENWMTILKKDMPDFVTKFNYPYKGTDDGFTTFLRTKFPDSKYAGIELEVNQKHLTSPLKDLIIKQITQSISSLI